MRKIMLAVPVVLAASALAASHAETTTYVDGNLAGVAPNSGATLTVSDEKQMTLRTGLANVAIPYDRISHAELGGVKETSHDVPFYKVWARKQAKTHTQLLIVNFKTEEGEEKTMTLELAQPAASSVYETITSHTAANQSAAAAPAAAPAAAAEPAAKTEQVAKAKPKAKPETKAEAKPDVMRTGKQSSEWWGDNVWKTTRNADKWNKASTGTAADQQQDRP